MGGIVLGIQYQFVLPFLQTPGSYPDPSERLVYPPAFVLVGVELASIEEDLVPAGFLEDEITGPVRQGFHIELKLQ